MGFLDKLFGSTKIKVQFIDNATDETIGVAEMSPDQLPETFSLDTVMHIREQPWSVEEAIPQTAAEFTRSKELVLKLRKIERIDPKNILYTLPTISNELPPVTGDSVYHDFGTAIREDDWRQNEFFHPSSRQQVEEEIVQIREVWDHHSEETDQPFTAFSKCHVRATIGMPQLSVDLASLKQVLGVSETGSLKINDQFVQNGFSLRTKESTYYGTVSNNVVDQLCISEFTDKTIDEILDINQAFGLRFINWYHCDVIGDE